MKFLKGKKGQSIAPSLTLGFVAVNILFFLIVWSFGKDGLTVGTSPNMYGSEINQSVTSSFSYSDVSFLTALKVGFGSLPFALTLAFVIFEPLLIIVIILLWIRGI